MRSRLSAHRRGVVPLTMVFAQLERARSSQRALAWHAHRARRGDPYLGRAPFGYKRARDDQGRPVGPLEIDEATAPLVRRAAELFLATGSMGEVQRFLAEHGYEPVDAGAAQEPVVAPARRDPHRRWRDGHRFVAADPGRSDASGDPDRTGQARAWPGSPGRPTVAAGWTVGVRQVRTVAGRRRSPSGEGEGRRDQASASLPLCPAGKHADRVRHDDGRRSARSVGGSWRSWPRSRRSCGASFGQRRARRAPRDADAAEADMVCWPAGSVRVRSSRSSGTPPALYCSSGSLAAEATPTVPVRPTCQTSRISAGAWRRGDLSVADKRRAPWRPVIERIAINPGVRGRSIHRQPTRRPRRPSRGYSTGLAPSWLARRHSLTSETFRSTSRVPADDR